MWPNLACCVDRTNTKRAGTKSTGSNGNIDKRRLKQRHNDAISGWCENANCQQLYSKEIESALGYAKFCIAARTIRQVASGRESVMPLESTEGSKSS